jgi:hypothetical protein
VMEWVYGGCVMLPRLVTRREGECKLFTGAKKGMTISEIDPSGHFCVRGGIRGYHETAAPGGEVRWAVIDNVRRYPTRFMVSMVSKSGPKQAKNPKKSVLAGTCPKPVSAE